MNSVTAIWLKETSALYLNLGKHKLKTKLYTVRTVTSYIASSQSVLNASCTLVHVCFSVMVIVNCILNYWIFLMSLLDVGSRDGVSLPRLQWYIGTVVWMWSNGIFFFLLALSVCSAASGQFPHMMTTFTLGSYTCTHLHSNANRNCLLIKWHWDSAAIKTMFL